MLQTTFFVAALISAGGEAAAGSVPYLDPPAIAAQAAAEHLRAHAVAAAAVRYVVTVVDRGQRCVVGVTRIGPAHDVSGAAAAPAGWLVWTADCGRAP